MIAFLDGDDWWSPRTYRGYPKISVDPTPTRWWHGRPPRSRSSSTSAKGWTRRSEHIASHFDHSRLRRGSRHGYWFIMGHPPMTSQVVVRRDRFKPSMVSIRRCRWPRTPSAGSACSVRPYPTHPHSDSIRLMPSVVSTVSATTRPSTVVCRHPHPLTRPIPTLPIAIRIRSVLGTGSLGHRVATPRPPAGDTRWHRRGLLVMAEDCLRWHRSITIPHGQRSARGSVSFDDDRRDLGVMDCPPSISYPSSWSSAHSSYCSDA